MATEQMQPESDTQADTPSKPEHQYRFKDGELIARRFKVIAPLGFGGFAEVYRCQDIRLDSEVAVKVLSDGKGLKEARAAVNLRHHNIVRVRDVSSAEDEVPYIVFEYVDGETLEEHLDHCGGRLPLERTLRIVRQVSEALDYAHEQKVIHRDIKPSNIMLDLRGNAYLTDFGLAEVKRAPAPVTGEPGSMLTSTIREHLSGTIPYMAPEQFTEGKPGDERSDLYSLGVVVYKMLTGQFPYQGQDTVLIAQIIARDPIPPTQANSDLPKGIEPVLLRARCKVPKERYASCMDFATDLEDAAQAFIGSNDRYEEARKLLEGGQWQRALSAFEALRNDVPGFKEAEIKKFELHGGAQKAVNEARYQDALDALDKLIALDPKCNVADLRQQARDGLAQQTQRTLDEQYRKAVELFQNREYQACLDALRAIRDRDPKYPDPQGIEAPARKEVDRQEHLRDLYERGTTHMDRKQWKEAVDTFETLKQDAPDYKDVDEKLASAYHLARMSSLLSQAKALLEQGEFADCIDKLDELQREGEIYRSSEVASLRQEAVRQMRDRAARSLQDGKLEEGQIVLEKLRARTADHTGFDELGRQIQDSIRRRDQRRELDDLYEQAVGHLRRHDHQEAWKSWQEIQARKGELDYADPKDVESRAKSGLCQDLYEQAGEELAQGKPEAALDLWNKVRQVDAFYPDKRRLDERIQAELKKRARQETTERENREQAQAMYTQAVEALDQGYHQQALELWRKVCTLDPNYPDSQQVATRAQAMSRPTPAVLAQRAWQRLLEWWREFGKTAPQGTEQLQAQRQRTRRMAAIVGGVAIVLIVACVLIARPWSVIFPAGAPPTPTQRSATPTVAPTGTRTPTATATVPTTTPTMSPTPVVTSTPVLTPTLPPSPVPVTPTVPSNIATARESSGIYAAPSSNSQQRGVVQAREQVTVTGRAAAGFESWLYIRSIKGIEGFVYSPRFVWSGNVDSLAVVTPPVAVPPTPMTCVPTTGGDLTIDLWHLEEQKATCVGEDWYQPAYIAAHGGDGCYTFYWNGEKLNCPASWECTFYVRGRGGTATGTGRVVSGDGRQAEKVIYVPAPVNCRWALVPPTPVK